jgi:hypothetical protein
MKNNNVYNKQLIDYVDNIVRETIFENKKNEKKIDTLIENVLKKNLKKLNEGKEKTNKKRSVIQWLQKPEVDTAEIRRKLEGEPESQEEEDSKRSYFMKKVNQSYGKDFTDKEVNDLYALKSSLGQ